MDYIKIFLIIVLILIISQIISTINANKKLKTRIINSFGKVPEGKRHDFDSISIYYNYMKDYLEESNTIDDITWDDIDMNLVLERINSCQTSIGEEYLYNTLRHIQSDDTILVEREKLISYLDNNPEDRLNIQFNLAKLGKRNYNGIVPLIFEAKSKALKYSFIYNILAIFPIIGVIALLFNMQTGTSIIVSSIVLNVLIYYRTKGLISSEFSAMKYFLSILGCINKIYKRNSYDSLPFFEDLRNSYNTFKGLRTRVSSFINNSRSEIEILAEYINIIFLVDIRNYNKVIKTIIKETEAFHSLYKNLGEIDMAISTLSFRKNLPISCQPIFHDENSVDFKDFYHPLLMEPVTNSGKISNDSIITGSNAAGKSTFIKALAVNAILAQTIYTCAAAEFKLRHAMIVTSMAVRDNITEGESYFIKEIKSLKRILDKVQDVTCMCFVDEILKGTNTIERIAASAAVLRYLHEKDCLCITASHDIELTQILEDKYDNYHFREEINDDGISFDYILKDGPSQTRNAIKLIDYMDFEGQIVDDAQNLADKFTREKVWPVI